MGPRRAARRIVAKGAVVDQVALAPLVVEVAERRLAVPEVVPSVGFVVFLGVVGVGLGAGGVLGSGWVFVPAAVFLGAAWFFAVIGDVDRRQRAKAEKALAAARRVLAG